MVATVLLSDCLRLLEGSRSVATHEHGEEGGGLKETRREGRITREGFRQREESCRGWCHEFRWSGSMAVQFSRGSEVGADTEQKEIRYKEGWDSAKQV